MTAHRTKNRDHLANMLAVIITEAQSVDLNNLDPTAITTILNAAHSISRVEETWKAPARNVWAPETVDKLHAHYEPAKVALIAADNTRRWEWALDDDDIVDAEIEDGDEPPAAPQDALADAATETLRRAAQTERINVESPLAEHMTAARRFLDRAGIDIPNLIGRG